MKIRNTDIYEKSNKSYDKALRFYNSGQLEKALEICINEEERVLYNPSFLNLKGLLYYLRGDMNEARKSWNLNYLNCKDGIAEKYLLDSKNDEELWKLYIKGLKYEKDLNVNEAIYALEKCKHKSDFNTINVNNALCKCYIEKCDYDEAILCMEKVFNVDCKNKISLEYRKTLIDLGILHRDKIKVIIPVCVMAICIFFIVTAGISVGKKVYSDFMSKKNNVSSVEKTEGKKKEASEEQGKKLEKQIMKLQDQNKNTDDNEIVTFPLKDISKYIRGKNYKELHGIIKKWIGKQSKLKINEIAMFNKAQNFMNNYAGQYFYKLGRNSSKVGNFTEAIEHYSIGVTYGVGKFPYEDNLYMLGVCYNKVNDIENSIRVFERYYKEYKSKKNIQEGNYIEDVIRYLFSMYKDLNNEKYKMYERE